MSVGLNPEGHSTGAHSAAPQQAGGEHGATGPFPSLRGYPPVTQMSPDTYIERLLDENGASEEAQSDSFFSLSEGEHGGGEHGEKKNQHTWLKIGIGALAAAALWKFAAGKKTEGMINTALSKAKDVIKRPKATAPKPE